MTVALLTAIGPGLGAASTSELRAQDREVAILSPSGKGEVLAQERGGLGVTGSNESEDDARRLVDGTGHVTGPNIRRHDRLARTA